MILQTTGANLAVKGYAKHIRAEAFPPMTELTRSFMDMGGKLMACAPCTESRGITEDELMEGAKVIAETTAADATLVY